MSQRVRLGELLVDAQIITQQQLDQVLQLQKQDGRRLGTLLVETGLVTETQVTQILSQQLSVPWVSLYHIDFSRQLLNLVPREVAERHCLVPIFVRRVRGVGDTLYVAMDDPSDDSAQAAVSEYAGLPTRAMIAPPSDILSAIRVYYGANSDISQLARAVASDPPSGAGSESGSAGADAGGRPAAVTDRPAARTEPEARRTAPADVGAGGSSAGGSSVGAPEMLGDEAIQSIPVAPEESRDGNAHAGRDVSGLAIPGPGGVPAEASDLGGRGLQSAASSVPPPESSAPIPVRQSQMPKPRDGKTPKMVTLTLLDGTEVVLPARDKKEAPAEGTPTEMTARDMVVALRAVSQGADPVELFGSEVRWEGMMSALLSLLLKKHLVADWEFVEEYERPK